MTDKPVSTKTPRSVRKGAPPTPAETLGALTAPVASDPTPPADAQPGKAKPTKPVAAKRAKPAVSEPVAAEKTKKPVSERTKPLNFRVTNEFRKAFKQAAATEDCKKVELLERIFEAWLATKTPAAH